METRIFFNPGDSVANIHDYNEAVRKGQILNKHVTMTNLSSLKILTIKNTQFFTLRMPYQLNTKNQSPTKLKIVFKIENDSRKFPRVIFYFDKNLNDHQQFWLSHLQAVQLMNQHRS